MSACSSGRAGGISCATRWRSAPSGSPRLSDVQVVPAQVVKVTAPAGEPIQADGDIVGETPAEFRVSTERLNLLMPDG